MASEELECLTATPCPQTASHMLPSTHRPSPILPSPHRASPTNTPTHTLMPMSSRSSASFSTRCRSRSDSRLVGVAVSLVGPRPRGRAAGATARRGRRRGRLCMHCRKTWKSAPVIKQWEMHVCIYKRHPSSLFSFSQTFMEVSHSELLKGENTCKQGPCSGGSVNTSQDAKTKSKLFRDNH